MTYLNKVIALTLLIIVVLLFRNVFKTKSKGRSDLVIENVRTFGAAILLLILAIGLFITKRPFCELFPYFCK